MFVLMFVLSLVYVIIFKHLFKFYTLLLITMVPLTFFNEFDPFIRRMIIANLSLGTYYHYCFRVYLDHDGQK